MYLRAASPTGGYYDVPDQLPQPVLDAALPDVPLVYWDYYHMDRASYRKLFDVHEQFGAPVLFAWRPVELGGARARGGKNAQRQPSRPGRSA